MKITMNTLKWFIRKEKHASIAENLDKHKAYVLPKAGITLAYSNFSTKMQGNVIILQI
jgi:hypothetical protein